MIFGTPSWIITSLQILVANESNLAAHWYRNFFCTSCSDNLLLVYQEGTDNKLSFYNSTAAGPVLSELPGNPTLGTGMSLTILGGPNNTTALRLFYQTDNGGLCSLDWEPSSDGTLIDGTMNYGKQRSAA